VEKARPSLAYLADKFNTAAPPGYVPGRGRGVEGFAKPPPKPPPRRAPAGVADDDEEEDEEDRRRRARLDELDDDGAGASADPDASGKVGEGGKLEGEAASTSVLDINETERFEIQQLSMEQADAGVVMEPFNMNAERREGTFDDDFNFVWKRKGEDPDDMNDAWLGEVDEGAESDEKIAKRKRLLQRQLDIQAGEDEAPPDKMMLWQQMVGLLQEGESVAAALRRLSTTPKGGAGKRPKAAVAAPKLTPQEQEAQKQAFDALTEAADKLLRSGAFDIYSETREGLLKSIEQLAADQRAVADEAAAAAGVSDDVHQAAVASGFVFDATSGVYYNYGNGLYFDPRTNLYWPAGGGDTYYTYDSNTHQFVPQPNQEAGTSAADSGSAE